MNQRVVDLCRNVLLYGTFSDHTSNLTVSQLTDAVAVLFPPDIIRAAQDELSENASTAAEELKTLF